MIATHNRSSGFSFRFDNDTNIVSMTVQSGKIPKGSFAFFNDGTIEIKHDGQMIEKIIGADDTDLVFFEKKPTMTVKDGNAIFTIDEKTK